MDSQRGPRCALTSDGTWIIRGGFEEEEKDQGDHNDSQGDAAGLGIEPELDAVHFETPTPPPSREKSDGHPTPRRITLPALSSSQPAAFSSLLTAFGGPKAEIAAGKELQKEVCRIRALLS
jgi:hypothetical protein